MVAVTAPPDRLTSDDRLHRLHHLEIIPDLLKMTGEQDHKEK